MKKFFLLLILTTFCFSCSLDDNDYPHYHLELIPTESIEIPEFFTTGKTHEIKLFYKKLSTCHYPNGIYFYSESNSRIIAVENVVYERNDCSTNIPEEEIMQEMTFEFKVNQPAQTVYIFKFFQGIDEYGTPIYHIIEIPVHAPEES